MMERLESFATPRLKHYFVCDLKRGRKTARCGKTEGGNLVVTIIRHACRRPAD